MNKELQDRLLEYLGSLDGAVRQAGGFVAEQAPLVAQEWVEYEFWSNALQCAGLLGVGLLLLLLLLWLARQQYRRENEPWIVGAVICFALMCPAFGIGFGHGIRAMKAKIAPRVVVLEKLASLTEQVRP